MKVDSYLDITGKEQQLWNLLLDFETYPQWNNLLPSIQASPEIGAEVLATLQYRGEQPKKVTGKVTGYRPEKYFSWIWIHSWGEWFYSEEHVLRSKTGNDGKSRFFYEIYMQGISMRFGRGATKGNAKVSLDFMTQMLGQELKKDSDAETQSK